MPSDDGRNTVANGLSKTEMKMTGTDSIFLSAPTILAGR